MKEDYSESKKPLEACPNCGSTIFCAVAPHASDTDPCTKHVQCSQCDARYLVNPVEEIYSAQVSGTSALSSETLNLGDVLRLPAHLGEIPAGLYMVASIGFLIELARCADNEDGDLASTHRVVKVAHHEIERFEHTYLTIPATL